MDPFTIAAIGGTALSSILGGRQASQTNQLNADIAMMNYYQQQSAQRAAIAEAMRQRSDAHLGGEDAAGNRTYFIPGVGWTTDLTPDQRAILEGTEDAQLAQLLNGGARAERVDARANDMRNDEAVMSRAAMDELRRVRPTDRAGLREMFLARGAQERNKQADAIGNMVAMQAIRAGGGGNAAELIQRGRGIADQENAQQAGIDATMYAQQESERRFDHARDRASSLYDYFRRASTSGTSAPQGYMPSAPQRTSTGVSDQGLINALGRAPQREYQQPNLAMTDTIGDLSTLFSAYGQERKYNDTMDYFKNRWGGNTGAIS